MKSLEQFFIKSTSLCRLSSSKSVSLYQYSVLSKGYVRRFSVERKNNEELTSSVSVSDKQKKKDLINEDVWAWIPPKDRIKQHQDMIRQTYQFEVKKKYYFVCVLSFSHSFLFWLYPELF
jgi:hypothetical protein